MAASKGTCSFDECGRPTYTGGLCGTHHRQRVAGKELQSIKQYRPRQPPTVSVNAGLCSFEGCGRDAKCRGLCDGHYTQWHKGRELRPLMKRYAPTECVVHGCHKRARMFHSGQALCDAHHQRWLKYGDATRAPKLEARARGMQAIRDAVASRSRVGCWTDWADLPCWDGLNGWGGSFSRGGYPSIGDDRVMWFAMEADGRPRPPAPDNYGLHSCDDPACWNPDHLRWGSHIENMQGTAGKMNYCQHCDHCNPA